jgi:hypothetical protein
MKKAGMLHRRALKRECGLPATGVNAASTTGFPHCGKGTDRGGRRLGPTGSELIEELTMAERKAAGKTTRKRPVKPRKAGSARRTPAAAKSPSRRWSQRVTEHSDALDLKQGVFKLTDPKKIAASLKRSAERSSRRKAGAYRSALSMLTFYINRAGKGLPKTQRERLERAKRELKRAFGKEE